MCCVVWSDLDWIVLCLPTLTFSFQILQRSLMSICSSALLALRIIWSAQLNIRFWRKQVLPRFRKQDLVPSNSQIQPPKFWLWIPMLPTLSHRTNLILQWPMPTDRGTGDKDVGENWTAQTICRRQRKSSVSYKLMPCPFIHVVQPEDHVLLHYDIPCHE